MRTTICLVLLMLASPALAQSMSQGAVSIAAAGVGDAGLRPGVFAAIQTIRSRGIAIGADVGLIVFPHATRSTPHASSGRVMVVGSGFIGRYWRRSTPVAPFINAGLSAVRDPDCCGTSLGWRIGAGLDYRLRPWLRLRPEASVLAPLTGEGGILVGRIGLVFRRR
jgi:hypothetical protein